MFQKYPCNHGYVEEVASTSGIHTHMATGKRQSVCVKEIGLEIAIGGFSKTEKGIKPIKKCSKVCNLKTDGETSKSEIVIASPAT